MKKLLTTTFTLAFFLIAFRSYTYRSGPGGGYANAPSGNHCGTSGCHNTTPKTTASALANLLLENDFTGDGYIPDSTYNLKLTYKQSSTSRWGFNLTALTASDNSPAGSFTVTSNRTQRRTKTIGGKTRTYMEHTSNGTSSVGTNATEWEFQWKAPSSVVDTIRFYAIVMASNANGARTGDEIYAKVFEIAPSTRLSRASISAKDSSVCSGETVSLFGSATNTPTQYSWTLPNGTPSVSTKQNPTVSYTGFGKQKAILRAKNAKGWGPYDTLEIEIKQSPTAFISGGNTRTICPGDSVKLTAQFNPNYSYKWSTGETGNEIWAKKAGDYNVSVTAGDCGRTSNTVTVKEYDAKPPSISGSSMADSLCQGESLTLTAGSGFDSLAWYNNFNKIGQTTSSTLTVTIDTGTSYRVRGWTSDGCFTDFSDSVEYVVIERQDGPTVSCKDREPFKVSFEFSNIAGHNGVQVSDDQGKTWNRPSSGATGTVHEMTGLTPDKDYELWVRALTSAPCYYTEVTKAICRTGKCSPLEAKLTVDTLICKGDEVNVELNGLKGEWFSLSFDGGGAFTDTIFQFSPQSSGAFKIEITDSAFLGCPPQVLDFNVKIDEIAALKFRTQKPNNTFCTEDTIKFTGTSGNDEYRFFVNNVLRATLQDSFYYEDKFTDGDSAYVEVTKGACEATSEKIYISVVPVPDASFTYSNTGSQYNFSPNNENYKSYFWTFGDGLTSVLMKPDHSYKSSENSTVTAMLEVEDNNDCIASSTEEIDIPDFSNVVELEKLGIHLYPSPVEDVLFVEWKHDVSSPTRVTIYTPRGENVAMFTSEENNFSIDLSNIAVGIYVIEVKNNGVVARQRIIKI
ncbi:MAG: T9SS type A sorting domain-containing protein [Bacteroidia bacterium]|nr:T9SS type A sorting domain-containing protein [Bacteroidia bacterium]